MGLDRGDVRTVAGQKRIYFRLNPSINQPTAGTSSDRTGRLGVHWIQTTQTMKTNLHRWEIVQKTLAHLRRVGGVPFLGLLLVACRPAVGEASSPQQDRTFSYTNDLRPDVPWSIHVFKFDRSDPSFCLETTLGGGDIMGKAAIADQVKNLSPQMGRPVAAVNGDFWYTQDAYPGDPMGLQIHRGELISGPAGRLCFWINAAGKPQTTNVQSQFKAVWATGASVNFGLNELRKENEVVLYTHRVGALTRTPNGVEIILERNGTNDWLPLAAGRNLSARVREIRRAGNSRTSADTLVLSFSPGAVARMPKTEVGAEIQLAITTSPSLAGAPMGIGASPTLVRHGKAMTWSGNQPRHPRTAIGWNDRSFFLVEVDGRQRNVSIGMTFPEIADYMLKLGCTHAVNLDGGASATMWVMGTVVNRPSAGFDRLAANALVVLQKESKPLD